MEAKKKGGLIKVLRKGRWKNYYVAKGEGKKGGRIIGWEESRKREGKKRIQGHPCPLAGAETEEEVN